MLATIRIPQKVGENIFMCPVQVLVHIFKDENARNVHIYMLNIGISVDARCGGVCAVWLPVFPLIISKRASDCQLQCRANKTQQ